MPDGFLLYYVPGVPKKDATCLTDYNFAFSASKLLSDGSF